MQLIVYLAQYIGIFLQYLTSEVYEIDPNCKFVL